MKAESTVRRAKADLRRMLDAGGLPDDAAISAYGMECALTWVLESCEWTPSTIVRDYIRAAGGNDGG